MSINFSRLFDVHFIFNPQILPITSGLIWVFYIFLAALIILAIVSFLLANQAAKNKNWPLKRFWRKCYHFGLGWGLSGWLLLFFRQASVYFLSMPIFFYVWFLGLIASVVVIIIWARAKMSVAIKELKQELEKKKYLT